MRCLLKGCPLCYAGRRGRAAYKGHFGYRSPGPKERMGYAMGMLKRPVVRPAGGLLPLPGDSQLAKSYPAVWEFLTLDRWDGGDPRVTGTLMLLCEDGLIKCWVHDRDGQGRSLWASGEALEDVLATVDNVLATGEGEWRIDRGKPPTGRRGR